MIQIHNLGRLLLIASVLQCQWTTSEISTSDDEFPVYVSSLTESNQLENEVKDILADVKNCREETYSCKRVKKTRLCSCETNCMTYADCCPEMHDTLNEEPSKIHNFSCKYAGKNRRNEGALMIASCEESFLNSNLANLCHKNLRGQAYDHNLDLPAISLTSNLTYQNYYCAVCNNDSENIASLTLTLDCNKKNSNQQRNGNTFNMNVTNMIAISQYVPNQLKWQIINAEFNKEFPSNENTTCHLKIKEFENTEIYREKYGGRKCHLQETSKKFLKKIDTCSNEWYNEDDIEKCSHYSLTIADVKNSIVYKNPHCAVCNFVNISKADIYCFNPYLFKPSYVPSIPSISVLFYIDTKNNHNCRPSREIWDPLIKKCKPIVCGSSFERIGDKCVSKNENFYSTSHHANCSDVYLRDYTILSNNSAMNNSLYEYNQYEVNGSAALVCPTEPTNLNFPIQDSSKWAFYLIASSEICLAIHILLYYVRPKEKTWNSRNLTCLSVSLFFAQLIFMFGLTYTSDYNICLVISILLHFFWLSSFVWMNVLSIDVFRTFRSLTGILSGVKFKIFVFYNIYAWGVPFVIVGSSLAVNSFDVRNTVSPLYVRHNYQRLCWINNPGGLLAFFIVPIALLVLANFVLFFMTSWEIFKQHQNSKFARISSQSIRTISSKSDKKQRQQANLVRKTKLCCLIYVKLSILQGMTWSLVLLTAFIHSELLDHLFSVCNSLQGILIFLCFDVKPMWVKSAWNRLSSRSHSSNKSSSGNSKITISSPIINSAFRVN